jgi:uncharacterized membrane protein YqaE (UPF0057 family)
VRDELTANIVLTLLGKYWKISTVHAQYSIWVNVNKSMWLLR